MTKTLHVPGQLRRHVIKNLNPLSSGERDLKRACVEAGKGLEERGESSLRSCEIELTNEAIGELLDIARDWLNSDNGNDVMAAKSMLKFELEYEPDDPRETRYAIKMPKSLAGQFMGTYSLDISKYKDVSEVVRADMKAMSWATAGASGRVRAETLGWFLARVERLKEHDHPAVKRAATKFLLTYQVTYGQAERLIRGYLEINEDQEPKTDESAKLTAAGFAEAIRGRGPEMQDDEPQEQDDTLSRDWAKKRMGDLVKWSDDPSYFYYGGSAKEAANDNGPLVYVRWRDSEKGKNKLVDAQTQEVVEVVHSMSHVWAVEAPTPELVNEAQGSDENEARQDDEPQEPKRLVVIACGGKKSQRPGKIPADERYIGNYFTACLLAAEVMDGPTMVLSAKYGLIPLTEEIENYDLKLGDKGSVRLGFVRQQVEKLGLLDAKVTVLGGEKYVKGVRQIWPDAEAPLKGGIGQQLKQLAGIYEGEALEDDEHQDQEPGTPAKWRSGELRNVMGLPGRYHSHGLVIWFGGKAGKRNPEPGQWVKVNVIYTGDGRHDLIDVKTQEKVMTCTLTSQIHWAPAQTPLREEKPAAVEESMPAGRYEVPENFLELAEEGNTDQAKAYWKRRCEQWAREGK